jgi:hypothetical protein
MQPIGGPGEPAKLRDRDKSPYFVDTQGDQKN